MNLLQGLQGTVAVAVLCGLLFLDEGGLPLPIAPSEVLLLVGGLLIASGTVAAVLFLPLATVAMLAGMLAGYTWSRTLGQTALCHLAERVGATDTYERACDRLSSAHPLGIALARVLPGMRPYATLVAGAVEVRLRTFLLGAVPALLVWEGVWLALGMLVGVPVVHYLGRFEHVLFQGGLLVVLGVIAYLALRRATAEVEIPSRWVPLRGRRILAALIDGAMVACIAAGLFLIGRQLFSFRQEPWIDVIVTGVLVVSYLCIRPDRPRVTANGVLLR